jgi:hypothetical protein
MPAFGAEALMMQHYFVSFFRDTVQYSTVQYSTVHVALCKYSFFFLSTPSWQVLFVNISTGLHVASGAGLSAPANLQGKARPNK